MEDITAKETAVEVYKEASLERRGGSD